MKKDLTNKNVKLYTKSQRRHIKKTISKEQSRLDLTNKKRKFRKYKQKMKKQSYRPRTAQEKIPWSTKAFYQIKEDFSKKKISIAELEKDANINIEGETDET